MLVPILSNIMSEYCRALMSAFLYINIMYMYICTEEECEIASQFKLRSNVFIDIWRTCVYQVFIMLQLNSTESADRFIAFILFNLHWNSINIKGLISPAHFSTILFPLGQKFNSTDRSMYSVSEMIAFRKCFVEYMCVWKCAIYWLKAFGIGLLWEIPR